MLATAIKPTSGTAIVDGHDIVQEPMEVKKRIGFLSGSTGLYARLTAREMVAYYGRLNGVTGQQLDERLKSLFDLLEMNDFLEKRNDKLSTGMKQRVSIARTMIHDPDVLFFDEPTSGLDVLSAESIVNFIKRCRDRGKTVILSTHTMDEVEKLCDRVTVIHHGREFITGTVPEVLEKTGTSNMEAAFKKLVKGEQQ
jgi:sodium transport system ATP-binding protein